MEYYFDNSATTKPSKEVIEAMVRALDEMWGNPSSLHTMGLQAEKIISDAKSTILGALNVRQRGADIIFTSSGTEADNLALLGCMRSKPKNKGGKLITTDSEHPAVLECARQLEREGYEVVYLSTRGGCVDMEQYANALDKNTVMVSVMQVNNETGAVYDIESLFGKAKACSPDIVTHTDAVQGFMKIPFSPERIHCDMATLSAHKIHGPKGAGALYVSPDIIKKKQITACMFGGGQQKGMRSGTENVPGIAGFAQAVKCGIQSDNTAALRQYLIDNMPREIRVNIPRKAAPHILNITLPNIRSETMLHFLSSKGIFVSSGSACSSNSAHADYVLPAFGLTDKEADSSIRISLDSSLKESDANVLLDALGEGLERLVRSNR